MASDRRRAYLEALEAGMKFVWNEVIKMASRGYSSTELGVMAKTRLATLHRDVEAMAGKLDEGGTVMDDGDAISERGSYLVNEEKAEGAYVRFRALLEAGGRGLAITRTHPADVAKRFHLPDVEAIWLSRTPGRGKAGDVAIADPTNLVALAGAVIAFLEAGGNAAVVLEGLEYLVSLNGFPSVLRFLQTLNEKVVLNESILLISADAQALKEQEWKQLAKEMAGEL